MSQVLIHEYLAELSRLRQASGSRRETNLRGAFRDLLKGWGRAQACRTQASPALFWLSLLNLC